MTQFTSIKEVVSFAKSGAKLAAIAASVLQNDKKEGLALLCEETIKAALAAALWNSPLKLLQTVEAIKNGKKNAITKQWLQATTTLNQALPLNKSGDVSRIPDESAFVSATNAAIAAWEKSWSVFEAAQSLKKEQRSNKATAAAPAAPAATDTAAPAAPAAAPDTAEFHALNAEYIQLEAQYETLLKELQFVRAERDALRVERDALLAELAALKAVASAPTRKRAKKETTA